MEDREGDGGNEQPRQEGQNQVMDDLLRVNQKMLRQGQLMLDMMKQMMGLQV